MGCFGNGDNCACSLVWILLLLSLCGGNNNGFGFDSGCGNNNSCIWIILLLLCCGGNFGNCGNSSNGNCGCGC